MGAGSARLLRIIPGSVQVLAPSALKRESATARTRHNANGNDGADVSSLIGSDRKHASKAAARAEREEKSIARKQRERREENLEYGNQTNNPV